MEFTALSGLGAALEDVGTLSLLDLPPLEIFEAERETSLLDRLVQATDGLLVVVDASPGPRESGRNLPKLF